MLLIDNEEQSEGETVGKGHVLEEFKEMEEVNALIDGLKNVYNDQIAMEMSCERFTGKSNLCLFMKKLILDETIHPL